MKILNIILLVMICFVFKGQAQQIIELNQDKVTQFIFPASIMDIKGGYLSSQILEETGDNVLYMQPVEEFDETNLNVITSDGRYYNFTLRYALKPQKFSHIIKESDAFYEKNKEVLDNKSSNSLKYSFERENKTENTVSNTTVRSILEESGYLVSRNSVRYKKMYLTLKGIYVHKDKLYFRILIENKSNISYDTEMISFIIKAKEKANNATQETTLLYPVLVYGNKSGINANGSSELIFEFDKFTIGRDKLLNIEMIEKSGERNLVLEVDNDWIINAKSVK